MSSPMDAVIVDAVRTPIGRAHPQRGWYRNVRADELAATCIRALIERTGIDPAQIEDVVLGCTQQTGEQGLNVARIVALLAGLPVSVAGTTVNRLCGSSLQALNQAAHSIAANAEEIVVVGGLEHMQHLPMGHAIDVNPKLFHRTSPAALKMGLTAEHLARKFGISRPEQDAFAHSSHQKAASAESAGDFASQLVPVFGHDERGKRLLVEKDQSVRADSSLESLAALQPVFLSGGTVTAGNSSPTSDGAAAMLVVSRRKAQELGLKPLAKVRSSAVVGVSPSEMGLGPVGATEKALRRAGLTLADIDLVEINEAFAAQTIACSRLLRLDEAKLNVCGGAIAIGHPLGASGARIATTLVHAMVARDAQFGLATMCIGLGQGIATILERV